MSIEFSDNLSWPTRLSRTRVSSVQGLSLGSANDSILHNFDDVLRTVQELGLKRCLFDDIETQARIGEGESFCVDRCLYKQKVVAVKHIKLGPIKTDSHGFNRRLRTVLNEIRIMHHNPLRNHPNILSVLGYGWKTSTNSLLPYIVVEYGIYGSLRNFLINSHLKIGSKIILIGDVAAGVNALHQCDIIHGDLKLDNIVVLHSWDRPPNVIAKICDFGHSILLTEDKKHFKYYGTSLYNPPEVENQDKYPIITTDLFKCDMWAFGLSMWEILADGSTFFKTSWRDYTQGESSLRSLLSDGDRLSSIESSFVKVSHADLSSGNKKESLFGNFDRKYLCTLGKEFVNSLDFGSAFVDKAFLRVLINQALQVDPSQRPSKITLGPIMSRWNPSDISALHAKLSIHTGTSEWSFNLLKADQEKEIAWEHQQQILKDFERIATHEKSNDEAAAASFQLGMFYIIGFGTEKNMQLSAKFLQKAQDLGHFVGSLFGPSLRAVISPEGDVASLQNYTALVIQGFDFPKLPDQALTLTLVPYSHQDSPPSYGQTTEPPDSTAKSELEIIPKDCISTFYPSYSKLRACVISNHTDSTDFSPTRLQSAVINSSSLKMNLLECAIAFRDEESVESVAKFIDPSLLGLLGEFPLITACRSRNFHIVRMLLMLGADPFAEENGCTFFHWLFMLGNEIHGLFTILPGLINHRTDALNLPCVTTKVLHQQWPLQLTGSPLAFAIAAGSLTGVAALLNLGANPTAPIHDLHNKEHVLQWTPVHLAVKYHSVPMLFLLALRIISPTASNYELSALRGDYFMSLTKDQLRSTIVKAFNKQKKLQISQACPDPESTWDSAIGCALSYSTLVETMAMHGSQHTTRLTEMIDILPISCLETASENGEVALMQAIDFNNIAVVGALLERAPSLASRPFRDPKNGDFVFPIHFASQIASNRDSDDSLDIIKLLVATEPSHISLKDSKGRAPLHFAVTGSSTRVTKWLLQLGVSVNAINSSGQAAIHVVRMLPNLLVLLEAGADINLRDMAGRTALHEAVLARSEELVKAFVDRKAKLEVKDMTGRTPQHCAVLRRSRGILEVLLKAEVNVNAKDLEQNTLLHYSVQSFRSDIFRLLLDYGGTISAVNAVFFTPLHQCVFSGDDICLEPLLSSIQARQPSLIHARDLKGQTPLHIAATLARTSMAKLLLKHGSSPELIDENGNTAFHLAVDSSDQDATRSQGERAGFCSVIFDYWESKDSSNEGNFPVLSYQNKAGMTPWDLAYQGCNLMVIELLLLKGGFSICKDLTIGGDYIGTTLLGQAINAEAWDLVMILLKKDMVIERCPSFSYAIGVALLSLARAGDKQAVNRIFMNDLCNISSPSYNGRDIIFKAPHDEDLSQKDKLETIAFLDEFLLQREQKTGQSSKELHSPAKILTVVLITHVSRHQEIISTCKSLGYAIGVRLSQAIVVGDYETTEALIGKIPYNGQLFMISYLKGTRLWMFEKI